MPRRQLLEPSRLAPVPVNLARVFLVGIGLWLVALALFGTIAVLGDGNGRAVATCAAGAVLGVIAVLWARRRGPQS